MNPTEESPPVRRDGPGKEQVLQALRQVVDPELGINIVDLGLVYNVEFHDDRVHVSMTMTSPFCPLHELVTSQAEAAIFQHVPSLRSIEIELVWDPPWKPEMMSEAARSQLGWSNR